MHDVDDRAFDRWPAEGLAPASPDAGRAERSGVTPSVGGQDCVSERNGGRWPGTCA